MFSFTTVIFSACSEAISSSTGATILQGPHHSAQKSTRTGLSLARTSSTNVASVTVFVLFPTVPPRIHRHQHNAGSGARIPSLAGSDSQCRVGSRDHRRRPFGQGHEVAFRVQRRRTAGPGGGDRLPVDMVDHV